MPTTILVVDDDPEMRRLLRDILTRAGYAVRAAEDGLQALHEIALARPDLVLADIIMPGLDGASLWVRLQQRAPHLPVILMSAYDHDPGAIAAPFVAKPFARRDLLAAVARALESSLPPTID